MTNSSPLPLNPAVVEYYPHQLEEFAMNKFDDRVNQLVEHLTPSPQGNNVGAIKGRTQGRVRGQHMLSPFSSSLMRTVEEKHSEPTQVGSQEDAGPIGRIVFTENARNTSGGVNQDQPRGIP